MKVLEQCCSTGGEGGGLKKNNDFAKVEVENALWILLLEAIKLLSCWETLLSC